MVAGKFAYGKPDIVLSEDQIVTAMELVCCGADEARQHLEPSMREPQITRSVRNAALRIKRRRRLTGIQILGEVELDDTSATGAQIQGRLDLMIQFSAQFGNEEEYLAVECKRVAAGDAHLNRLYVTEGVKRFATGKYSMGHRWAIMLGYVLVLPVNQVVTDIDKRLVQDYGTSARLRAAIIQPETALSVYDGDLKQGHSNSIRLKHVFVDMVPAR